MVISLLPAPSLPPGRVRLPGALAGGGRFDIRLGTLQLSAVVDPDGVAPDAELWLAADLWEGLSVPYAGIRLAARMAGPGLLELGPAVGLLYFGADHLTPDQARTRAQFHYGDRFGAPGLMAFGCEQEIDWERGRMEGYVLDNRPGAEGEPVKAWFPIPQVVRLTWSINREVIERLKERTGGLTFNWARNIGKWEQHALLSKAEAIAPHLPETRLLKGPADAAVMLARHRTIFVKDVWSIKGRGVARLRAVPGGIEASCIREHAMARSLHPDLPAALAAVEPATGSGRRVVQQGVNLVGREGRSLDFRVLLVREGLEGWRCPGIFAKVAPDNHLAITNEANGAEQMEPLGVLQRHHGMDEAEARACTAAMAALCEQAARALAEPFHPLGILGFDVAVDGKTRHLWLLEANSVPGWDYPDPFPMELGRSQVAYALHLTGFPF